MQMNYTKHYLATGKIMLCLFLRPQRAIAFISNSSNIEICPDLDCYTAPQIYAPSKDYSVLSGKCIIFIVFSKLFCDI